MNIVIDTNVVISGTFFGGAPRRVLEAVVRHEMTAFASPSIIAEYNEVVEEMISRKQGDLSPALLTPFILNLRVIVTTTEVKVCRDPDDDKFLECAVDSDSLYVVSGDKDLLELKRFEGVNIITAAEFCNRFL